MLQLTVFKWAEGNKFTSCPQDYRLFFDISSRLITAEKVKAGNAKLQDYLKLYYSGNCN